jgi:hypothetical protein
MKHALLTAVLVLAGTADAGTVLEITNRDLTNNSATQAKTYAQAGRMRIESGGAQDTFAIFRDDTLYTFDPQQKTYIALDRATIQQLAAQLNPALKKLQEQMASMPPEQRAQMERMLGMKMPNGKTPTEEIRKTSRTGSQAGHSCTYAEAWEDGVRKSEMCVVPAANLKGSKELYDVGVKASSLLKEMVNSLDLPMLKQMTNRQMENFDSLGGVPLITRTFDGDKPVHEAVVEAIRNETLADSLFEIPAGYKRQQMPTAAAAGR